jgi:ABC-2 type transport system ATP-binding protein
MTSSSDVLIEVEGLTKHYGDLKAVDGIDFKVRRGDVLGFLGPNGAGKTTAMKMITGFLEPDAGSVRLAGYDMAVDSLAARRKLGYIPENAPAYPEMTVDGFLRFIAEVRGIDEVEQAIDRVVDMTGLEPVYHQTIDTLSKGFKRRVGLAQALIHEPEVLILDEPTDGLDPNQKAMVQELILRLSGERAILLSTHILDEAERVCNRALILSQGKILVDSTPQALMEQSPTGRLDDLFRNMTKGVAA